jgi:hypothetical protein
MGRQDFHISKLNVSNNLNAYFPILKISTTYNLSDVMSDVSRSQWPCGLTRGSSAASLLGSWVRIPPGGHGCLYLVSVVCCQVEVSATSWSLVQRSPTDCGVSQMCVIVKPRRNEEAQAHIGLSSHREKMSEVWLRCYFITPKVQRKSVVEGLK